MPVHTMKDAPRTLTHEMQTDAHCTADYVLFSKLANWRYATHTSLLKESMILPTTKNYGWGKVECGASSQTALVRWLLLDGENQCSVYTHTETHILPHTNARTHARTHTHTREFHVSSPPLPSEKSMQIFGLQNIGHDCFTQCIVFVFPPPQIADMKWLC